MEASGVTTCLKCLCKLLIQLIIRIAFSSSNALFFRWKGLSLKKKLTYCINIFFFLKKIQLYLIFYIYLFFWLNWVLVVAHRIFLYVMWDLLSRCTDSLVTAWAPERVDFSSCMWDLSSLMKESTSPALQDGFLTIGPPGKFPASTSWFLKV